MIAQPDGAIALARAHQEFYGPRYDACFHR
jgi:hypothetical protein